MRRKNSGSDTPSMHIHTPTNCMRVKFLKFLKFLPLGLHQVCFSQPKSLIPAYWSSDNAQLVCRLFQITRTDQRHCLGSVCFPAEGLLAPLSACRLIRDNHRPTTIRPSDNTLRPGCCPGSGIVLYFWDLLLHTCLKALFIGVL